MMPNPESKSCYGICQVLVLKFLPVLIFLAISTFELLGYMTDRNSTLRRDFTPFWSENAMALRTLCLESNRRDPMQPQ
jgi:hypothetical protein